MKEQVLSIEQMKELEGLGIDTSKASMCWLDTTYNDEDILIPNEKVLPDKISFDSCSYEIVNCTPTFTLQDILEILPKKITNDGIPYIKCLDVYYDERYLLLYINREIQDILHEECNSPLQAAFKMLKYVKQNNFIL